jgi:hypothetical protein
MASAGTVTVDFAAETAKFTAELKKVQGSLKRLEGDFKSVERVAGAALRFFSGAALLSFAKAAFTAADATADAAERAGIAVESFSRLQFAAGQADVEMSALTTGITKLQTTLSKASTGGKEAIATLSRLGLEAKNLSGLAVEDQLAEIAQAFTSITDPADRTRFAVELFGKAAGPQLVPFLAKGRDGIRELTAEADRLGITMSQSTAAGIGQADRAIKQLTATLSAFTAKFVAGLSIAILGPPEAVLRLDEQIKELETRRDRLLSGGTGRGAASSAGQAAAKAQAEEINKQIQALIDKQRELLGLNAQAAATPVGAGAVGKIAAELELINIEAIEALKINVDELGQAFDRLNQSIVEIQNARSSEALQLVNDAVLENQRQIEQLATAEFQAELDKRSAATQAAAEFRISQEQRAANAMVQAQRGAFNAAIGALQSFAGQSKKVAIALVLINKARAIAEAIQNTALGATLQLTTGDPYTAVARASAVKAFGALQIAAIVASGFGEIKSINASGGAPLGSPSNPINTQGQLNDREFGASPQAVTQVIIANNVGFDHRVIDQLIDGIREATDDRDVIIFGPDSRQAKELVTVNG